MGQLLFLYDFEFVPYQNPPGRKERFEEALRELFQSRGLDYGMSALGGMVHTRGDVRGKDRPVTEEDRRVLASWAASQRVVCVVRIGAIEENHDGLEFFREITEWVFAVNNLAEGDE